MGMATRTGGTRDRMIVGATALMRSHGFTATSLKDVWEQTGAPRGSVYFHFPGGKEELGLEVIRAALSTLLTWTEAAERNSRSAPEFVRSLAGELARFLEDSGFEQGCPIAAIAIESPPEYSALRSAADDAFAAWSERIAAALVGYGVAGETATASAKGIASALEGGVLVSKAGRSTEALRLTGDLVARAL